MNSIDNDVVTFGKYRNEKWEDVPKEYLLWLQERLYWKEYNRSLSLRNLTLLNKIEDELKKRNLIA